MNIHVNVVPGEDGWFRVICREFPAWHDPAETPKEVTERIWQEIGRSLRFWERVNPNDLEFNIDV